MVISDTRLCREFAPTLAHLCESMGRLPLNWRGVVTVNAVLVLLEAVLTYISVFLSPVIGMYAALDLVYGVETSDPIRILCDMILSNYFGILVVTLSYMIMIFQFIVSCVRALKQENSSSLMLTQTEDSDNEKWYEDLIRMLVKFEFFLAGFSITFVLLYFWFESNSLFANVPMISNHYFALYILVYVFVSTSTLLILCRVYFVEEWISSRGQVPIILACYNLVATPYLVRPMIIVAGMTNYAATSTLFMCFPLSKLLLYKLIQGHEMRNQNGNRKVQDKLIP